MTENIGIMDPAYFVSKNSLLNWINDTFKLNMNKVEQACTGAVYCQILDSIYPGKVKMNQVNWHASLEPEYLQNYKVLQQAFSALKIGRHIEVQKLTKGGYLDNLEFLQWMKGFWDKNYPGNDYDAEKRRFGKNLVTEPAIKKRDPSQKTTQMSRSKGHSSKTVSINTNKSGSNISKANIRPIQLNENDKGSDSQVEVLQVVNADSHNKENTQQISDEALSDLKHSFEQKLDIANDQIKGLKTEISTLKSSISEVGKERDFYYSKLRDIEVLTSKPSNTDKDRLVSLLHSILFSEKIQEVTFDEAGEVYLKDR